MSVVSCGIEVGDWCTEKGQNEEDKMAYEHRKDMEEVLQDLHEKDQKMEEVIDDYEVQVQVSVNYHLSLD